jgi:hypothetical protein
LGAPAAYLGTWANAQDLVLELDSNGDFTLTRDRGRRATGTWSLQEDGSLALEGQPYAVIPHGNLLLLGGADTTFILDILHRVDEDGNLVPFAPARPIEVPPIDASALEAISIVDGWTGLSPLAPIEAYYRLEPTNGHFSGMAEFSVAGYTEAMTRSVAISVPLAVIEDLVALLASTPLEVGKYRPVFSHTDDFPNISIVLESRDGDLGFSTKSQGSRHIPWGVVVGRDQYVTYADTPAQALDLLDPYLARDVQEALFDLALSRDP